MSPATDDEKRRKAAEARRLLNEPLLAEAMNEVMGDAFAEFKAITVTPDTIYQVIALQQRALAAHAIRDCLEAMIAASGQMDGGVVVEKKPTE